MTHSVDLICGNGFCGPNTAKIVDKDSNVAGHAAVAELISFNSTTGQIKVAEFTDFNLVGSYDLNLEVSLADYSKFKYP